MAVLAEYDVIDFQQIHCVRGNISLTCCQEQKAALLSVGSVNVVVLLPLCEIDNYLVKMFSDMRCLQDNVSCNCQTNTVAQSV